MTLDAMLNHTTLQYSTFRLNVSFERNETKYYIYICQLSVHMTVTRLSVYPQFGS